MSEYQSSMAVKTNYIILGAALLLAIPTSGLSLLVLIAWHVYKWRQHQTARKAFQQLSLLDKVVLGVGRKYNGSMIGTAVDEMKFGKLKYELIGGNVPYREYYYQIIPTPLEKPLEFTRTIFGQKFDVDVRAANDGAATFRVRNSNPDVDALYTWLAEMGLPHDVNKWDLLDESSIIIGSALHSEALPSEQTSVPASIGLMQNLRVLGLINRNLNELPQSIELLTHLEELKLGGNAFTSFPDELCKLTNLKLLTFWFSDVMRLPEKIGNLRGLEGLDFTENRMLSLPESIIELRNLKRLYMTGNQGLILSDRQAKWLACLIDNGTEVHIDTNLIRQLAVDLVEYGVDFSRQTTYFNWKRDDLELS